MEPREGGAKAEPTGRRVEVEGRDQRLEAVPEDPLSLVKLVTA